MDMKLLFVIFIVWGGLCYASDTCQDGICENDDVVEMRGMMEQEQQEPIPQIKVILDQGGTQISTGGEATFSPPVRKGEWTFTQADWNNVKESALILGDLSESNTDYDTPDDIPVVTIVIREGGLKADTALQVLNFFHSFYTAAGAGTGARLPELEKNNLMKKPLPKGDESRFKGDVSQAMQTAFITGLHCEGVDECVDLIKGCNEWAFLDCVQYVASQIAGDIIMPEIQKMRDAAAKAKQ